MAYDRIIVSHCEGMTVIYHWGDKRLPVVHTSTLLRSYRGPCMEPCTAILDSMTEGRCMAFTGVHRHGPSAVSTRYTRCQVRGDMRHVHYDCTNRPY